MTVVRRLLACFGNGHFGRLGLGPTCASESLPRIVGSLVGYDIKHVACGGAHTAVVTGIDIELLLLNVGMRPLVDCRRGWHATDLRAE